MQLLINDSLQTFIPIKDFREQHHLPATFGLASIQPKDWRGLGSIDRAGNALNDVRDALIAAVPGNVFAPDWINHVPRLATVFEAQLHRINETIGLRDEEIAFAVNGFGDVCSAVAFAIVRAKITHQSVPPFVRIYSQWLHSTVNVGGTFYDYLHKGEKWVLRVVIHAYGRVGLEVRTPKQVYYVVDKSLSCPAEGYMYNLLQAVAKRMIDQTA